MLLGEFAGEKQGEDEGGDRTIDQPEKRTIAAQGQWSPNEQAIQKDACRLGHVDHLSGVMFVTAVEQTGADDRVRSTRSSRRRVGF